jgi:CubicO group peptidase (beta-lactamase class C family)
MVSVDGVDRLLSAAVSSGAVPGVMALAANPGGVIYEGAFGKRGLASGAPMTRDTVFRIHSMTKAVTAVAAMQLVEQGKLALDQPAGEVVPQLAAVRVLEGFDRDGKPRLRPARSPITLRRLLTHTSGFVYDLWNADQKRYQDVTGFPPLRSGRLAALEAPLAFEPGDAWEYGIGIDWVGRLVEAVSGEGLELYFRRHIFAPLGMSDTAYRPDAGQIAQLAETHARQPDGGLQEIATPLPASDRQFWGGGGGLFSTGRDYLAFLQMLLQGGRLAGATLLQPETVALMAENHIGALEVPPLKTQDPATSNDVALFPGMVKKWGLIGFINTTAVPGGRRAGSTAWAGLANTYFWVDPDAKVTGLLLTQILPFADPTVLSLLDGFERAVYRISSTR